MMLSHKSICACVRVCIDAEEHRWTRQPSGLMSLLDIREDAHVPFWFTNLSLKNTCVVKAS